MFITFEGIDKCGKTTQSLLLYEHLNKQNQETIWTREPGSTDLGNILREFLLSDNDIDPMTEFLLFMANRVDHYNKVIKPNLDNGINVICDRFIDSTLVYQGYCSGIPLEVILQSFNWSKIPFPDVTFVLQVNNEEFKKRCSNSTSLTKYENDSFYKKITHGFLELYCQYPHRIKLINANQALEAVSKSITDHLQTLQ